METVDVKVVDASSLLINLADMDVAVLLDKDYEAERGSMYLTAKRNQVSATYRLA